MRMKFIVLLIVAMLVLSGCGATSKERIASLQNGLNTAQSASQQLEEAIPTMETQLSSIMTIIADPNVPPDVKAKAQAFIEKIKPQIENAKAYKAKIDNLIASYQTQLTAIANSNASVGGEISAVGAGVSTIGSILPPPFGTYAAILGLLITTIGGIFTTKRAASQSSPADKEFKNDVVQSVFGAVDKLDPAAQKKFKEEFDSIAADKTYVEVTKILRPAINTA